MSSDGEGQEDITEAELINAFIQAALVEVHVSMPVKVEAYDKAKGTVDVVPQLNRSLPDGAGNYVSEKLPKLQGVPVVFPRVKKFAITFPIEKGDYGSLVFADRNTGNWRGSGNQGDPGDLRTHTLDGAQFHPGLYPDSNPPKNPDDSNMVIGSEDDGDSRIEIKPSGGMNLGAGATEKVITKKDLQALYFAINAAVIVANDGGASFKSTLLTGLGTAGWTTGTTDGQLGSSKIKAVR